MGSGVFKYAALIQVAVSMLRRHGPFCDEIAFRCGAEFGMQRAGDIGRRGLNLANHGGPLAFEPLSYVVRRLCKKRCRGMSFRRPSCSARMESPSARLIMCKKPKPEKRAPSLFATEFTTSRLPRVTSTSVTASSRDFRFEIASKCGWLAGAECRAVRPTLPRPTPLGLKNALFNP